MRQALALLFALPCLSLPALRSRAELDAVTSLDVKTVALANYVGDASFALTLEPAWGLRWPQHWFSASGGRFRALGPIDPG